MNFLNFYFTARIEAKTFVIIRSTSVDSDA